MPAHAPFEWERPLLELEQRLAELRAFSSERGVRLQEEIEALEQRAQRLREEIYRNLTPWQRVLMARHSGRPTFLDYVAMLFDDFIELHGDRRFRDDPAVVGGLARFEGRPVTVIGTQKGRDTKENLRRNFGLPHPEGYRKALRLMQQAEKFGRPIITFIDVVGAFPGIEAEQRGQGVAIAENIMAMAELRTPIVCVVTGEGGSGGALAIGVGDRVFMLEHAWYSVISPEMCATILWRDSRRAPEAAAMLRLTAQDLLELGIIDGIIPEPLGGAHREPRQTAEAIRGALRRALEELEGVDPEELVARRYQRYRSYGVWVQKEQAALLEAAREAAPDQARLPAGPAAETVLVPPGGGAHGSREPLPVAAEQGVGQRARGRKNPSLSGQPQQAGGS
ncbi:MAG TPA: acetyl-CoA carboxylase carboxyltransferase subunit alpha [Limnochordales bacterium]